MAKGVWGLDVSKSSTKLVRMELRGETPTLTHVDVVRYAGGESGDASNLDQQILDTLQDLKANVRFGNEPIWVSLPGHSTFNRLIKLPPVEPEKIPEIVRYEAQSQIPFNIDEVIWDYQLIDREYEENEEREVILFAIKRDTVDQFLTQVMPLGLNIEAVQFGPVALYNFLSYDQESGGTSIALDLGGDNTDLIILDGAKFWIRNLPVTGNDITRALQKTFNLPFPEAEKLKLKAGQSQQAQKIFNAVQPVLRDLVGEIHRSIGYYKSISKTAKFDKILLLGNATKTLNFQKFVSQSLSTMGNLPAARIQKLGKIDADAVDPGLLSRHLTTLGCALGLALQGMELTRNQINLLPPAYAKKKELKKKQPFMAAAVAVLYVLVAVLWLRMSGQVGKLQEIQTKAEAANMRWRELKGLLDSAKQIEGVEGPLKTVASLSSERDLLVRIMNTVNACLPENVKLDREGRPLPLPSPPEEHLRNSLWIVDWRFEEESREAPKTESAPTGQPPQPRLATVKGLIVTLEIVVLARASQEEGRDFIISRILDPQEGKSSVLKLLGLPQDKRKNVDYRNKGFWWDVTTDGKLLEKPLPSFITNRESGADDGSVERKYLRYTVTLSVPMNAKDRAELAKLHQPVETPKP